jgi:hypothetical protein
MTDFADVYETTHEGLVAESTDSVLSLISSCILHNSVDVLDTAVVRAGDQELTRIPTTPSGTRSLPSINRPSKKQPKKDDQ